MKAVYETAEDAIAASAISGEIERLASSLKNFAVLELCCEDSAHANEIEYWGEDDQGHAWRVHVVATSN